MTMVKGMDAAMRTQSKGIAGRQAQTAANTAATLASIEAANVGTTAAKRQLAWQTQDRRAQQEAAGGVGDSMSKMIENYNLAFGEAKTANEARYQGQLDLVRGGVDQRTADIRSDFGQRGADITQGLQNVGMGNTTVGSSLQAGNLRDTQSAVDRSKLAFQAPELKIMADREDAFPDLGGLQSTLAGAASGTVTPQVAAMLKAFGNIRSV